MPGVAFADVVMVELRDIHAALSMEQIRAFLPFSREWLERTLGVSEPDQLFLLEADRNLQPEIREIICYWSTAQRQKDCPAVKDCTCFRFRRGWL